MKGAQVSTAPPTDVRTPAEPAAGVQLFRLQLAQRRTEDRAPAGGQAVVRWRESRTHREGHIQGDSPCPERNQQGVPEKMMGENQMVGGREGSLDRKGWE